MGSPKRVIYLLLIPFFFSLWGPLFAKEKFEDLERELNFDLEQKIKADQIRKKYMEEILATREEILKKRLELLSEAKKEHPDPEKVIRIRKEIEDLKMRTFFLIEKYREELREVLSDEQKRRLDDYWRKERKRMKRFLEWKCRDQ